MPGRISTPFTDLFKISAPIALAGMNQAAGPELAAAVTNHGGIGVIGGVTYTPKQLRELIRDLKDGLNDKKAPFGVDLLLPAVGGSARATNYEYTKGKLDELIDVVIEEKTTLFVSAVGVPPRRIVDKLHAAGILVMNMVGDPKHVAKALAVGVDLICAQGSEAGGHTGSIPTFLLIPACVAACKGKTSPLTGQPIQVLGAGGVYNGQTLAAALALGATGVWVGTRFVAATESGAPKAHQEAVCTAGWNDTRRSLIFTGRPCRVRTSPYIDDWEDNRQGEIKSLTAKGIIPVGHEDPVHRPYFMGVVAGAIDTVEPASVIMDNMINEAVAILKKNGTYAKL